MTEECKECDNSAYTIMNDPKLPDLMSYCADCIVKGKKAELD